MVLNIQLYKNGNLNLPGGLMNMHNRAKEGPKKNIQAWLAKHLK